MGKAFFKPPKATTTTQNIYGMNPYDVEVLKRYFDVAAGRNRKMSIQEFFFFVGIMNPKIRGEALIDLVRTAFDIGDSSNRRNYQLSFDEFLQAYSVVLREQGKVPDLRPGYSSYGNNSYYNNNCQPGCGNQSQSPVFPPVLGRPRRSSWYSDRPRSEFSPSYYDDDYYDYDYERRPYYDDYDMSDLRRTFRNSPFYDYEYDDYTPPRYQDYGYDRNNDYRKLVYRDQRDFY